MGQWVSPSACACRLARAARASHLVVPVRLVATRLTALRPPARRRPSRVPAPLPGTCGQGVVREVGGV